MLWGTFVAGPGELAASVRQACMIVPGSGRSACVFVSEDDSSTQDEHEERVRVVRVACAAAFERLGDRVRLMQALPDPREQTAIDAFVGAGFVSVGTLLYLAGPIPPRLRQVPIPAGCFAQSIGRVIGDAALRSRLCALLDRTYAGTLDCPELCGMRDTVDVLDSHLSSGKYKPGLWLVLTRAGEDIGCCFLNMTAAGDGAELVYLGLVPEARGRGLGKALLSTALQRAAGHGAHEVCCAVDERNAPAIRLYTDFGLSPIGTRLALVLPRPVVV